MLRRFLASKRASVSTFSETSASLGNDIRFEDVSIKTEESEKERLVYQLREDDEESVVDEELSFIVDYLGSDQISEVQSVPLLMETLKRVKKHHTRTIRVDFVIRDGILKVSNVLQGALLITAPLYAVALCAQEQLRGFDSTFAINITRKQLHMCHVFQADSRLEASSIVKSVAVSFKSVGRLLKDKRERSRTNESTSLHSSERIRADSTGSQCRERTRTDSEGSRERNRSDTDHIIRKRHQACSSGRGGKAHLPTLPSEESLDTIDPTAGTAARRQEFAYIQVHHTLPRDSSSLRQQNRNIENEISTPTDLQDVVNVFSRESISDLEHSVPPSDEELPRRDWGEYEERGELVSFNDAVEAIIRGDKTSLDDFLNEGLPVNAENKSHLSLLHYAVLNEKPEIVAFLLERGADPNWEGPKDQTPLHCAAAHGNRGITKLLLENGANVRAKDRQFRTPLHLCAGNLQSLEVSYVLVEHGARIEENDLKGARPVDLHMELREMQNRLVHSACEAFAISDLSRSRSDSGSSSAHSSNLRLYKDYSSSPKDSRKGLVKSVPASRTTSFTRSDDITVRSLKRSRKGKKSLGGHENKENVDVTETLRNAITDVEEKVAAEARVATATDIHRRGSDPSPYSRTTRHREQCNPLRLRRFVEPSSRPRHKDVDGNQNVDRSDSECSTEGGHSFSIDHKTNQDPTLSSAGSEMFGSTDKREDDNFNKEEIQCHTQDLSVNNDSKTKTVKASPEHTNVNHDTEIPNRLADFHTTLVDYAAGDSLSCGILRRNSIRSSKGTLAVPGKKYDMQSSGAITRRQTYCRRGTHPETSSDDDTDLYSGVDCRKDIEIKDERQAVGSYSRLFKRDPVKDALSLLVTLSANPECHSSILESLCLPKPSSRLVAIAYSNTEHEPLQQIATLIGNLFSPARPDTKSKAVQAGLLKTVIDLMEAPDPIQATCLSVLKDLLQSENDKDYTAAVTSVPIDPLISVIEKSGKNNNAIWHTLSSNIKPSSKGGQTSSDSMVSGIRRVERISSPERRIQTRKLKPTSCQDDIGIIGRQKSATFIIKDNKKSSFEKEATHSSGSGPLHGSSCETQESVLDRASPIDGKQDSFHHEQIKRADKSTDVLWDAKMDLPTFYGKTKKLNRGPNYDLSSAAIPSSVLAKHVSMKMLAAASTNSKIQMELSKKRALQLLSHCAANSDNEIVTLAVCAIANIALNFETHQNLEDEHIQDDLIPLLGHKEIKVRYHAARGLIYLGNFDVEDVYLYNIITELPDFQSVLFSEDSNSEKRYVRGISLEHMVLYLTTNISLLWDGGTLIPSSPNEKKCNARNGYMKLNGKSSPSEQQIINFILTMYQTFTHPVILMRLLLHRFHDPVHFRVFEEADYNAADMDVFDRFGPLPVVHARLMRIWITWMDNFPQDFCKHSKMTEEISELIEPMRCVGGPYEPCAEKLESLIENVKSTRKDSNGSQTKEVEIQHDMLYEQCQNSIVSGALPCTEDDYVFLGGLQLYVEDICLYGPDFPLRLSTIDSITPTRIKQSIYPSAASSKVMVRRIRAYYEHFCEQMPTERNAKHNYIDCCQGLEGYGCRFFKLKQRVQSKGKKRHYPRLFGVSSKRIAILDEKTKAPIEKWSFRDLRTWEPTEDNLSVSMHFKSATREFHLDNKSQFKELTNYILTCTMEINYQGLRNIDASPWSRASEELGAWGAPAVRKYLQKIRSESDRSPDGTLSKCSPPGRERSKTFMPVGNKRSMSPFGRCQSYAGRIANSVPAKPGESGGDSLRSIRGGDGPETSGSSGSSGMCAVDQGLKTSYLESLVSGASVEPTRVSGRRRRSRGASFITVKDSSSGNTSLGMPHISELSEKMPILSGGVEGIQGDVLNYYPNKSLSNRILTCQCSPDADLPNLNRQDFSAYELLHHPKELARQITLIDHELFRAMTARDVQEKLSLGIIRKIVRPDETPHTVERVAQRFNQLSNWISFCIVSEKNIERRSQLFVNFIETAKQCLELRNYNAVMSIVVAALGSAPVRRLHATKELIQPEFLNLLSKMEILMDTKNNYKKYREALRTSPTPAVPYFGIYLKDLTFISDGNPNYFRGGLINLNKRRLVYVLLDEVHRFQRKRYNIQEVAEIRRYLLTRPQTSEDQLHKMSREIEPSVQQRALDDAPGPMPIQVEKRVCVASTNTRHTSSSKIIPRRILSVTKSTPGSTIV